MFRFETEAEAIAIANGSPFGLAGYFYTRDLGRAFRMAEKLKFGQVGVNEAVLTTEVAPFGGVKDSGSGREGSKYGLEDYLDVKYVCIGGSDRPRQSTNTGEGGAGRPFSCAGGRAQRAPLVQIGLATRDLEPDLIRG